MKTRKRHVRCHPRRRKGVHMPKGGNEGLNIEKWIQRMQLRQRDSCNKRGREKQERTRQGEGAMKGSRKEERGRRQNHIPTNKEEEGIRSKKSEQQRARDGRVTGQEEGKTSTPKRTISVAC